MSFWPQESVKPVYIWQQQIKKEQGMSMTTIKGLVPLSKIPFKDNKSSPEVQQSGR